MSDDAPGGAREIKRYGNPNQKRRCRNCSVSDNTDATERSESLIWARIQHWGKPMTMKRGQKRRGDLKRSTQYSARTGDAAVGDRRGQQKMESHLEECVVAARSMFLRRSGDRLALHLIPAPNVSFASVVLGVMIQMIADESGGNFLPREQGAPIQTVLDEENQNRPIYHRSSVVLDLSFLSAWYGEHQTENVNPLIGDQPGFLSGAQYFRQEQVTATKQDP